MKGSVLLHYFVGGTVKLLHVTEAPLHCSQIVPQDYYFSRIVGGHLVSTSEFGSPDLPHQADVLLLQPCLHGPMIGGEMLLHFQVPVSVVFLYFSYGASARSYLHSSA